MVKFVVVSREMDHAHKPETSKHVKNVEVNVFVGQR